MSLPTRNGNFYLAFHYSGLLPGFEPTYKEWKPIEPDLKTADGFRFEPTYKEWKPERNKQKIKYEYQFWAYLQGMETWGPGPRPPAWGPFWAYLQGMETPRLGQKMCGKTSFEPTYKEWKQIPHMATLLGILGFEPTYKEWKLLTANFL